VLAQAVRQASKAASFADVPSATAILDRFLHHAEVIAITGKSYRLRKENPGSSEPDSDSKPANLPTGSPDKKKPKSPRNTTSDEAA
jgi:hypothetical protein